MTRYRYMVYATSNRPREETRIDIKSILNKRSEVSDVEVE